MAWGERREKTSEQKALDAGDRLSKALHEWVALPDRHRTEELESSLWDYDSVRRHMGRERPSDL